MRILQINTYDVGGGAERSTLTLTEQYRARGHDALMAVGEKRSDLPWVLEIPTIYSHSAWSRLMLRGARAAQSKVGRVRGMGRLARGLRTLAEPGRYQAWRGGHDFYEHAGLRNLLAHLNPVPDILHMQNLHGPSLPRGGFFDLRDLAALDAVAPVVLTLRDAWLLSGHCAHSLDCERWRTGCGSCPYLDIYPAARKDATASNWQRRRAIYRQSQFYVSTASNWMMNRVMESIVDEGIVPAPVGRRVISNGIDIRTYQPGDQTAARIALNLPPDSRILLFVAISGKTNSYKNYAMLKATLEQLGTSALARQQNILMLSLGDTGADEQIGNAVLRHIPPLRDPQAIARYYQASDLYLHPAKVESFGLTVAEAMACGIPVIATAVGALSELIEDGRSGYLVPSNDAAAMQVRIVELLQNPDRCEAFGARGREIAAARFDQEQQANEYLTWYGEIRADWLARRAHDGSANAG